MPSTSGRPEGYPAVTPYLCVKGAAAAIDFLIEVFGARERMRLTGPDGILGHAELEIGDSLIMLADEFPDLGIVGPHTLGGTSVTISVYVDDVDATHARALAAGATELVAPTEEFYGDRTAKFSDPFGHRWSVATRIEDVSPEEIARRAATLMG